MVRTTRSGLRHPIPVGMRDVLPEEAERRDGATRLLRRSFELWGFSRVEPPLFEIAEVLERGLGELGGNEVLRFVEPESGAVAALRPDVTPQVARIVATRLVDRPPPYRIYYEGAVVRKGHGRSRSTRQLSQVGVELCGSPGPDGDLELLEMLAHGLVATGLASFRIDLGDSAIVRALLQSVPDDLAIEIGAALARKDAHDVSELARGLPVCERLVTLASLHGGREAGEEAMVLLAGTSAAPYASRLVDLFDRAHACGLGGILSLDMGDVRGFAYYTGTMFHVWAKGAPDAVASGGRYDELLSRFGAPMPAAGFAIDLDRLGSALRHGADPPPPNLRVAAALEVPDEPVAALRASGISVARIPHGGPLGGAWARAWHVPWVLDGEGWLRAADDARFPKGPRPPDSDGTTPY